MNFKIVTDSSSDMLNFDAVPFAIAPLKIVTTEKEYYDSRPSIMLTVIDNADEIYQNFKESECAAIFSKLEQLIDSWANSYGALCRKYSNARMMIFAEERAIQKMIADKFSILEKIREFTYEEKSADVTLSIGVGKEASLEDSNNSAKQALDMAQSRGGDQVAIKHQAQYKFYGGVSQGVEKRNKVKTRLIAKSISERSERKSCIQSVALLPTVTSCAG